MPVMIFAVSAVLLNVSIFWQRVVVGARGLFSFWLICCAAVRLKQIAFSADALLASATRAEDTQFSASEKMAHNMHI